MVAVATVLAAFLLGVIIWVATDNGRIKITVDGPRPIVKIDGKTVRIEGLDKPITLRAGKHEMAVKWGDAEFPTRTFTVRRGDNEELRVDYEPKTEPPAPEVSVEVARPSDGSARAIPKPVDDVPPPVLDRKRYTVVSGEWSVDGVELVQTSANEPSAVLMFGDERWTDYDFTVEAMRTVGGDSFSLFFRGKDQSQSYAYVVSGKTGGWCYAEVYDNDCTRVPNDIPFRIENDKWYTARVEVRAGHVRCFLRDGDGEVRLPDFDDDRHSNGRVGLRTWRSAYRFKNINVTAPDGRVLWAGLPALDARKPAAFSDPADAAKQARSPKGGNPTELTEATKPAETPVSSRSTKAATRNSRTDRKSAERGGRSI